MATYTQTGQDNGAGADDALEAVLAAQLALEGAVLRLQAAVLDGLVDEPPDIIADWRKAAEELPPSTVLRTIDGLGEAVVGRIAMLSSAEHPQARILSPRRLRCTLKTPP